MKDSEYQALQERLTNKMNNNPYATSCTFNYASGYKEGVLAAKSILSDYHRTHPEANEQEEALYSELVAVKVSRSFMLTALSNTRRALQSAPELTPALREALEEIENVFQKEYDEV